MTIQYEFETEEITEYDYKTMLDRVIMAVLDAEKCPYEVELTIVFTDNEEIHKVNREFRQVDRPTDVLSFPMIEYETPGDFSHVEDHMEYFHPETGELLLGDVMISMEKMKEQAEEYGHSEQRELAFLVAHSMLHLCGYDHMEEEERKIMEDKQRKILEQLGITRD